MARRVYFAFDYVDVFAVNQIRRSGQFVGVAVAGFADASLWEKLKQRDDAVIRRSIDSALMNTSVTVACIGERTASRRWVKYELAASLARGNGLLGVYLPGTSKLPVPKALADAGAPVYQWNAGRFGAWIDAAALRRPKR
jgi:hypothetical protein